MSYNKKVDANQAKIVHELKALGLTVCDLSAVGQGVPDLIVGFQGVNLLVEVKNSRGVLTSSQKEWHERWKGKVVVAYYTHDILYAFAELVEYPDHILKEAKHHENRSYRRSEGKREVFNGFDAEDESVYNV